MDVRGFQRNREHTCSGTVKQEVMSTVSEWSCGARGQVTCMTAPADAPTVSCLRYHPAVFPLFHLPNLPFAGIPRRRYHSVQHALLYLVPA